MACFYLFYNLGYLENCAKTEKTLVRAISLLALVFQSMTLLRIHVNANHTVKAIQERQPPNEKQMKYATRVRLLWNLAIMLVDYFFTFFMGRAKNLTFH